MNHPTRLLAVIAAAVAVAGCAAESTSGGAPRASGVTGETASTPASTSPPAPATETPTTEVPDEAPEIELTNSQQQAIGTAEDYLEFTAFSRSGLIEQLEFEGFSKGDAEFAVDQISVDWNEQAAKSAEDYLAYSHFSRAGLIDQLEFEGYTHSQAVYGVDKAGL